VVTFAQQFDAAGRRTQLAATIASTKDFVRDYTYDNLGRIHTIKAQDQSGGYTVAEKYVDFAFDVAGQPDEVKRYSDLSGTNLVAQTGYTFDNAGRLTDLTHGDASTTLADYDLAWHGARRLTDFDFTNDGGSTWKRADYTYDDADQLTDVDYESDWQDDEDYDYDSNGNRDTVTYGSDPSLHYGIGQNNQMTGDGTYAYEYDAEGNRTKRYVAGSPNTDVTEYQWDHRNRLVTVTHYASEGGTADMVVEYAYDFGNRWVRKVFDSNGDGTTDSSAIFVYDANQIALHFDKTGTGDAADSDLSHRYLWGAAVDQILADEEVTSLGTAGDILWPLTDNLGSVRDLAEYDSGTDTTSIVNHRVYNAFGDITSETALAVDHLFAYTGRPLDEDTELQNNLHRWYDLATGRWMSEDPIGLGAGDANLYRYVGNNVLVSVDPRGLHYVPPMGPMPGEDRGDLRARAAANTALAWYIGVHGNKVYSQKTGLLPILRQLRSLTVGQGIGHGGAQSIAFVFANLSPPKTAAYNSWQRTLKLTSNSRRIDVAHELVHTLDDLNSYTGDIGGEPGERLAYGFELLLTTSSQLCNLERDIRRKDAWPDLQARWGNVWSGLKRSVSGGYQVAWNGGSGRLQPIDLKRVSDTLGIQLRAPELAEVYNDLLEQKGYPPGCRFKVPEGLPSVLMGGDE